MSFKKRLHAFLRSVNGATAIEYALIASIMVVMISYAFTQLDNSIADWSQRIANALQ